MNRRRNGAALLFVATLASLLVLMTIAAGVSSVSNINVTSDEKIRTKLELACESAINRAKQKIDGSFNNDNLTILEPFITFQGADVDDTGLAPEEKAFSDENFVTSTVDYYTYDMDNIEIRYSITNGRDDDEDGWLRSPGFTTNKMRVEAVAAIPGGGWIGMTEDIYARRTSLFMYQIFFQNDLEILPGANFNLRGLIHSNENIYLNSEATLSIYTDSLTSAGDIHRGRLDNTSINGTVRISQGDEDGTLTSMNSGEDAENADWVDIATNKWNGTVRDSSLGATAQAAPNLRSFQPGGYYDTNAGLNIKYISSTNSYRISVNGGTPVTYTSAQLGNALTETSIYDYREDPTGSSSKKVKLTNVDINALQQVVGVPSNGVVYMTRDDAVPDNDGNQYSPDPNRVVNGFKLVNSTTLNNPNTLVSNLPVYVQGNFNKHTSVNPATDTWKPCAVIADAITLLSNSWNDANSVTKKPIASSSEYNFVFITGNVPTRTGQYSGGLENFPRFLENWTGKTVSISGGFMQLFRSSYSTGLWNYGTYYTAPNRNWQSEPRFSDLNDLPPEFVDMFPSAAVSVISSGWELINKADSEIGSDLGGDCGG